MRETSEESEEQLKKGAINERLNRRKKKGLNEMLSKKRLLTHQNQLIRAKGVPVQEEILEEQRKKEETCDIGLPVLTKHRKKSSKPRKSKKRCWVCKQPGHLKRKCPYIRRFYCHQLWHIKADCRDKKWIISWSKCSRRKRKKRETKKETKNKTKRNHWNI